MNTTLSKPVDATTVQTAPAQAQRRGHVLWRIRSFREPRVLLVVPVALILAAVTLYPFLRAVRDSLYGITAQDYFNGPFVGLDNYRAAIKDPTLFTALRVTAIYTVATVGLEFVFGFGLALLLNRPLFGKRVIIALLIAPMFVAPVLMGYSFMLQVDPLIGPLPYWLEEYLHFDFGGQGALGSTWALPTMILIDVWQWTPFMFILLYAGLQTQPQEVIEAARLDGAGPARMLWSIVVPLLRPIIAVAVLFRVVDAVRTFDTMHVLTDGGPVGATTTISVFIDHTAFLNGNFGETAALSVILIVLITIAARFLIRFLFGQQIGATR